MPFDQRPLGLWSHVARFKEVAPELSIRCQCSKLLLYRRDYTPPLFLVLVCCSINLFNQFTRASLALDPVIAPTRSTR